MFNIVVISILSIASTLFSIVTCHKYDIDFEFCQQYFQARWRLRCWKNFGLRDRLPARKPAEIHDFQSNYLQRQYLFAGHNFANYPDPNVNLSKRLDNPYLVIFFWRCNRVYSSASCHQRAWTKRTVVHDNKKAIFRQKTCLILFAFGNCSIISEMDIKKISGLFFFR